MDDVSPGPRRAVVHLPLDVSLVAAKPADLLVGVIPRQGVDLAPLGLPAGEQGLEVGIAILCDRLRQGARRAAAAVATPSDTSPRREKPADPVSLGKTGAQCGPC